MNPKTCWALAIVALASCDSSTAKPVAVPARETAAQLEVPEPTNDDIDHFARLRLGESTLTDAEGRFGVSTASAERAPPGYQRRTWTEVDAIPGGTIEMLFDADGRLRHIANCAVVVPEEAVEAYDGLLEAPHERRALFMSDGRISKIWRWKKGSATFWLLSDRAKHGERAKTTLGGSFPDDLPMLGDDYRTTYQEMPVMYERMRVRSGLMAGDSVTVGALETSVEAPRMEKELRAGGKTFRPPEGSLFLLTSITATNRGAERVPDPLPGWVLLDPRGNEMPLAAEPSSAVTKIVESRTQIHRDSDGLEAGKFAVIAAVYVVPAATLRELTPMVFEFRAPATAPPTRVPFSYMLGPEPDTQPAVP